MFLVPERESLNETLMQNGNSSPEFITQVKATQQQILSDYASMLKNGGELVYSTCSILPSENQEQIEKFLKDQNGKFVLLDELHCWPSEGFDGFYMARLGLRA